MGDTLISILSIRRYSITVQKMVSILFLISITSILLKNAFNLNFKKCSCSSVNIKVVRFTSQVESSQKQEFA